MRNRLSEIERRMTDVQDVMIALSEKIDRLDMGEKRDMKSGVCGKVK